MDAALEVKSKLDVADIVGEYLQLKPAGSGSFKALCPFHQEKTPSFYVNRPRQSWHCFGCDKGGDIITFVMDMEGMEFRDALEHLATKAGVALPAFDPQKAGEKKRLYEVNDLASKFFRAALLQSPDAAHARSYAAKRGIDDLAGDLFKIGYAPNSWSALTEALTAKGVSEDEMLRAGLVARSDRPPADHAARTAVYDRFRDRLMFTIQDVHGNIVGFTGRLLNDSAKEAKYVNTPETAVYKKSAVLYGLDKAKGAIKREDLAVIVEGNMDVLSSHMANVTNVVCSSGTALTDEQLRLLRRFTTHLAIAFDADKAGVAATIRGLDIARAQDFDVRIITLPADAGKDPDDAVRKNPELWKRAIKDATDVMEWVFHNAFRGRDPSQPDAKKQIAANILAEIRRIADPIVRDHWIKKLAGALEVGEGALREALRNVGIADRKIGNQEIKKSHSQPSQPPHSQIARDRDLAERMMAAILLRPDLFSTLAPNTEELLPEDIRALYTEFALLYTHAEPNDAASRPAELHKALSAACEEETCRLLDYLILKADHDFQDQSARTLAHELETARSLLQQHVRNRERLTLEHEMRAAELAGDQQEIDRLSQKFRDMLS